MCVLSKTLLNRTNRIRVEERIECHLSGKRALEQCLSWECHSEAKKRSFNNKCMAAMWPFHWWGRIDIKQERFHLSPTCQFFVNNHRHTEDQRVNFPYILISQVDFRVWVILNWIYTRQASCCCLMFVISIASCHSSQLFWWIELPMRGCFVYASLQLVVGVK